MITSASGQRNNKIQYVDLQYEELYNTTYKQRRDCTLRGEKGKYF